MKRWIELPGDLEDNLSKIVLKGSVAINGVSLTVADLKSNEKSSALLCKVCLIPFTVIAAI